LTGPVMTVMNELLLERPPEAFHRRIIKIT
jgi:hypothetical protein